MIRGGNYFKIAVIMVIALFGILISFMAYGATYDSDNDGVPDLEDKCPGSLENETVDQEGCDPFQFCAQFSCGPACERADFLNNDPSTALPRDCGLFLAENEGQLQPKCVPLDDPCKPAKQIILPEGKVQMKVNSGSQSYFNTTLQGIPYGFGEIRNTTYLGWCSDEDHFISMNTVFNASLYNSYDPDLAFKCPHCVDPDWDLVNYIINHKQGSKEDVQDAIWFFINHGNFPSDPDAQAMIAEALANGEGFIPQTGQNIAIIVDISNRTQLTFIEVDP